MIYEYLMYYVLFIIAFIYLGIGLWAARSIRTLQQYFLANQSLGVLSLTIALITSQIGNGIILAIAHRAYLTGFWSLLYTAGICLGLLILGCGVAYRIKSLGICTVAEIFQTHYRSQTLQKIASLASIMSLWCILLIQIIASKTIFIALDITDPYIFLSIWIFVIAYNMLGGLSSIVMISIIQMAFLIVSFVWASKWMIPRTLGSFITLPKLNLIQNRLFHHKLTIHSMLPLFYLPIMYSLIEQDIAQKFFSARSKTVASIAAFLACIGLILFSILLIIFSVMSKIENVDISHGANPLILILKELCPAPIFTIIICAILGGIMTTASSLINAINANIIQDFTAYLHFQKHKLLTTKTIALLTSLSALSISFFIKPDLFSILEISYRYLIIGFFIPIFMAYWIKPNHSLPAWLSIIAGFASYWIVSFSNLLQIQKDFSALALSFLGFLCGYLFTRQKKT